MLNQLFTFYYRNILQNKRTELQTLLIFFTTFNAPVATAKTTTGAII